MGIRAMPSIKAGACSVFRKAARQHVWQGGVQYHFAALRGATALSGALHLASGISVSHSAPCPRPIFGGVYLMWPKMLDRCVAGCFVPLLRGGVRPLRFSAFLRLLSAHAALPFSSVSACRRLAVSGSAFSPTTTCDEGAYFARRFELGPCFALCLGCAACLLISWALC
ncbi:hypothetical protein TRVL_04329 [Trypanosoma vivax]|nr:hypothetical protein TRVL_04329 [Trypanosoma vivax]